MERSDGREQAVVRQFWTSPQVRDWRCVYGLLADDLMAPSRKTSKRFKCAGVFQRVNGWVVGIDEHETTAKPSPSWRDAQAAAERQRFDTLGGAKAVQP